MVSTWTDSDRNFRTLFLLENSIYSVAPNLGGLRKTEKLSFKRFKQICSRAKIQKF